MDDNETTTTAPSVTPEVVESTPVVTPLEPAVASAVATTATPLSKRLMWYGVMVVVVLIIGAVLWFFLEKEGRVSTSVFSSVTALVERTEPVATVNGVNIPKTDFESNLKQLSANATQQGVNTTDEAVMADLRKQAVESLVNTELLRQEATKAKIEVKQEDLDARYAEIEKGLGGPEGLASRMLELSVTDEMLRRDIANDILIQALLETAVDRSSITVSEDELKALYDQAGGEAKGLPPFAEVKPQVEQQVRFQKEQALVAEYVAKLRTAAKVEVLI